MERRIPVTNNTKMNLHVGSNIVPPGETRDFPESQVPHHLRPVIETEKPAEAVPGDPLAELLKGNVKIIVAALNGMLLADIERLGELEQAGQARKGVLSAIAEIQLNAASQADMLAKIGALTDEELADQIASLGTGEDPALVSALQAEAAKRAGATE